MPQPAPPARRPIFRERVRRRSAFPPGIALLAAHLLLAAASAGAAEKRPVTFDDLMQMKSIGAPAISPDGASVLFTVRQWEAAEPEGPERKEARSHVWLVPVTSDGTSGETRQLTFGERGESAPAWSPDGRFISFLAARGRAAGEEGPRPQVWIMRSDGGEAWALTEASEGVSAYEWSPTSGQIVFTARDPLSKEAEEQRKRRDDARVFEGDFRNLHLWVIDVASRTATRLTDAPDVTVRGQPRWSPDGSKVAFSAAPTPMIRDDREDVYVLTVATKALEKMTSNLGPDQSPAWSPDGSTIAFVSDLNTAAPRGDGIPLQAVGNARLMSIDVATKRITDLSNPQFDLSPGDPTWAPDGQRILFSAGSRAYSEMFAFDVGARRYAQLTKGRNIRFGSLSRDGARAAFTMDSTSDPSDIWVSDLSFSAPRRLTTVNPQAADFALGDTEVISWKSPDGVEIEGVLLKPVGFQPGRRYPLLVVVHGGPTGVHQNGFRVGPGDGGQHWAGQGWAVLFPNPRGSTNYGEKFMRANIGDWGGGDYRDIMAGVDALVQRGLADADKLAVMGWSYGGYMTCWIVSQTGRFKAAMMGAGLSDLPSMYGTTDIPGYLGTFFGGSPSPKTDPLYRSRSGITTVDRVTTPLLILHGGSDERVPIGQPMEFFRALKDGGKTVELAFYPREGHGFSEYYHQLDRLRRQYEWLSKYTLGDASRKIQNQ